MRSLALTAGLLFTALIAAQPAAACDCARIPDDKLLVGARAAVIAKVGARRTVAGGREFEYRLTVERSFKRRTGRHIRVRTDRLTDCGLYLRRGRRIGLRLHGRGSPYHALFCDLVAPERLKRAAGSHIAAATGGC